MGCGEEIDRMLRINLCEAGTNEEIFAYVAWIRDFNINESIYSEFCHEFYSTYEFDEVCADDELKTKKIIKFRLGGRAHSLTLLEFARRLGLYHAEELDEEGFDVYFQGGLYSDEHFNAQEYWLSISREENLSLSRSHASTIRNPVMRTPKRVCECCLVDCKIDEKKRSWDLDTTTHRELIDSEGMLIPEAPHLGVPRVVMTSNNVYFIASFIPLKVSKRHAFWSLNEDILKITILKTNTPYPSRKIRRICACTHQRPQRNKAQYAVFKIMDDPNITMKEYIMLEEEKARRRGQVFNWQTATYGKIRVDDKLHDLSSVKDEFPAIVINDAFAPQDALQCKSQVSTPFNDEIDFRISFDESDDEDYTIICDKTRFLIK
ncbi:hypothetical protein Tco_1301152 [Tanacetum coccineum]